MTNPPRRILGAAALQRCINRIVFNPALAAEFNFIAFARFNPNGDKALDITFTNLYCLLV
jgi:hypothetical protein